MSRIAAVFLVSLLAGMITGCASPQMSRIDRNRDVYETWPIDIKQAVLDGKVQPGMTPDMVRVALGKPDEVQGDASIGDEIWVYRKGGSDGSVMYPGGVYPGGAYPGAVYPGGGGNSIGLTTGSGGTGLIGGTGVGLGTTLGTGGTGVGITGPSIGLGGGGGLGGPIYTPPTPAEVREVVFRDGVVKRADEP